MKRAHVIRFVVALAAIALVAACDQRSAFSPNIKGGGSGGGGVKGAPVLSIDTLRPSPVNVGDSILVAVHVKSDSSLTTVQLQGLTVKGSANLGTLSTTNRYMPISVPVSGTFRAGLRDTVIMRTMPLTTLKFDCSSVPGCNAGAAAGRILPGSTTRNRFSPSFAIPSWDDSII